MGGYDCLLFMEGDIFPDSPKKFWEVCKDKMMEKSGYSEREFNSLWYHSETRFRIYYDEEKLIGVLDW